jgi:hypothetical protein
MPRAAGRRRGRSPPRRRTSPLGDIVASASHVIPSDRTLRILTPLVAAALAVVATFARQQIIPKHRTIWAEDGTQFVRCVYSRLGPLRCLSIPYGGVLHVVPHLAATVAVSVVSPRSLSVALTTAAAVILGLCSLAVARAISHVTRSAISGLIGGAALALVFQAGREVIGNLTNLHWVLLTTGIVLAVAAWLGHRPGALEMSLVVGGALSSGLAPMLPALAAVGWALRRPRAQRFFWMTATAAALQVAVSVAYPRSRSRPKRAGVAFSHVLALYATEVVGRGPFGGLRIPPDWTVTAGALLVLALLIITWGLRRWGRGIEGVPPRDAEGAVALSPLLGASAVATFLVTGTLVFGAAVFVNREFNPRYTYVASVLAVEALVTGAAFLQRMPSADARGSYRRLRPLTRLSIPVVFLAMATGFARSFAIRARASAGPDYQARYEHEHGKCATGSAAITIPISPYYPPWAVTIPCSRVRE